MLDKIGTHSDPLLAKAMRDEYDIHEKEIHLSFDSGVENPINKLDCEVLILERNNGRLEAIVSCRFLPRQAQSFFIRTFGCRPAIFCRLEDEKKLAYIWVDQEKVEFWLDHLDKQGHEPQVIV